MRLVHVISGYLPHETAGTQILVRDLCRAQRSLGHRVEVFTRRGGRAHAEFELSRDDWEGVPVTRITNNFEDVDRFELLYTHPTIDARFDEYLGGTSPDLVHIHHLTCLSTSMIDVAARRGIPVVMSLNDYWMICLRGQRFRPDDLEICETLDRERCVACLNQLWPHLLPLSGPRSLLDGFFNRPPSLQKLHAWEQHVRRVLNRCHVVTAPSAFHRDRFIVWGADAERVFVAPPGVVRPAVGPRVGPPVGRVGFIGTVIPSKGVHVLCQAFDRLDRADLVLDVYGEIPSFHGDTTYEARLREMIRPHLRVNFHGRYEHEALADILASLNVLVVPALWWESYCMTVREGALAGLPVIASRLGGIGEAVDQGLATGVRPGDVSQLAAEISAALERGAPEGLRTRAEASVPTVEESAARIDDIYRVAAGAMPATALVKDYPQRWPPERQ